MNLRILSFAALAGLFTAAGCGGGGTSSGIAPTTGNSTIGGATVPSSTARGTLTASFQVPVRYVASTSSASSNARKPQYISPGSSGIEVLLGSGTTGPLSAAASAATWIVGQKGTPVPLVGTPGAIFSGNKLSTTNGFVAGSAVTYSYQPSSSDANFYTFTLNVTGLSTTNFYTVGVVLTDITNNNFILSNGTNTTLSSLGTLATANNSGAVPLAINLNAVVAKAYLLGPALIPGVLGTGAQAVGPPPPGTYELTLFAADELGYVIPSGTGTNGANAFDTGQSLTVAQFPTPVAPAVTTINVTVPFPSANGNIIAYPNENTTNPIPVSETAAGVPVATPTLTAFSLLVGTAISRTTPGAILAPGNAVSIAAPSGGLPNQPPVFLAGSPYLAGVPINVANAASASTGVVQVSAYLNSPLATGQAGTVAGYTYVPGTNYPKGTTGLTAPSAIGSPVNVNFTPGLYPVIQSEKRN